MRFPISTGLAAQILDVREVRLADLIRRKKIDPVPEVIAGRRQWLPESVLCAMAELKIVDEQLWIALQSAASSQALRDQSATAEEKAVFALSRGGVL